MHDRRRHAGVIKLNPFVLLARKFSAVLFQKDGCGAVVNGTIVIVGSFAILLNLSSRNVAENNRWVLQFVS